MAEDPTPWVVTQVTAVQGPFIKKNWLPVTKTVDDTIFFKFLKFDRNVIMALTGKGLELRSSKQPHLLNGKNFDQILALRHAEANRRYRETMEQYAEAIGEEWNPSYKARYAKSEHKLVVGQTLSIELPPCKREDKEVGPIQVLKSELLFGLIRYR